MSSVAREASGAALGFGRPGGTAQKVVPTGNADSKVWRSAY